MSKQFENANYTRQHEMLFAPDLYSTTAPFDDYSTHASSAQYNPTPEYSSFLLFYNIFHSSANKQRAYYPRIHLATKFRIIFFLCVLILNSRILFYASRERDRETHRFRWIDSHMIYNLLVRGKSNE